jgi:outer membrane protein assembly factor BamB
VVGGVPSAPLVVGTSAQLTATPQSSTGAPIAGQAVAWTSSDTTVAIVSVTGLVTALSAGHTTIAAAAGGRTGSASLRVFERHTVVVDGGTLQMLAGRATLVVPFSAVSQPTMLLVGAADPTLADPRLVHGTAVEVGPADLVFARTPTLNLRYEAAALPPGISPAELRVHRLTNGAWVPSTTGSVDTTRRIVFGLIPGAGTYAVVGASVGHVVLGGALLDGALVVGQSFRFTAATLDGAGTPLAGRPVAWASSDLSVATVDPSGVVTGVGAGTVRITASSEGRSASTSLTILPRPTADWRSAADWATVQGNARHTGYAPVLADPAVFRERWVVSPLGGAALHAAATGGGLAFVSSAGDAAAAGRAIAAVDLQTGAVQWTQPFSGFTTTSAPAAAEGAVFLGVNGTREYWAFDMRTGAVRFRVSRPTHTLTRYLAPVVVGGVVYGGCGEFGGLCALDATTGAEHWFSATLQLSGWTPAVEGGVVYAYPHAGPPKITALDAASGRQLYEIRDPEFSGIGYLDAAPVVASESLVLATNGNRLVAFDLQQRRIAWVQRGSFVSTPAVAEGTIYTVNADGAEMRALADGALLHRWTLPTGRVRGPLLATRNLLFASSESTAYAFDIASRRLVWSYPAGGALAIAADGTLLIAQSNGRLAAVSLRGVVGGQRPLR